MSNKTICIVGLGLLGGCYAQALSPYYHVTAVDVNPQALEYALHQGWISQGETEAEKLIGQADVLVLGLYPSQLKPWLETYQNYCKPNTIITDVSGVKSSIVPEIQDMLRDDLEYISCHPMAGKEVSGVFHSDASIFKVANFIVTPTTKNRPETIEWAKDLAKQMGFAHITELDLRKHDEMIGFVSQLTHVIAVSLMNTKENAHLVEYTGDSFRDLTRIAKINEPLWSELFLANKEILLEEIEAFQASLEHFKETLAQEDRAELSRLLIQSTERRKLFDK